MSRAHHAYLITPCPRHGDEHNIHLISRDDAAWLAADLLKGILEKRGHHGPISIDRWREGDPDAVANAAARAAARAQRAADAALEEDLAF